MPDLCNGLRNYLFRVLQSLEAGDPKHHAVKSLWDDAGNFSEPESEEEEEAVFIRGVNTNEDSPNAQHAPHRPVQDTGAMSA